MKFLGMTLRREEPEGSRSSSCTVRADRALASLLQQLREGKVDQQTIFQLQETSDSQPELSELLAHVRGCAYCRPAVQAGLTRALSPAQFVDMRSPDINSELAVLESPAEAIAVLSDRGRMEDWKKAVQFLLRALPLDSSLRRRAHAALSSCKGAVRRGTDLWSLLEEADLRIMEAKPSIQLPEVVTNPLRLPHLLREPRSWLLIPVTLALLICIAGWFWSWLRSQEMTALLAEQRAEASVREQTEVKIRQQLTEMSQRWTEAEREIAALQGKPPEQTSLPLRVAVFQLFSAAAFRGDEPPGILEMPKDAGIVTFNLASLKGIQVGDQAILSRTAGASAIDKAGLLRQGSGHTVSFPTAKLEDGAYTLQLVRGTGGEVVEIYNFRVRRVTVSQVHPQE